MQIKLVSLENIFQGGQVPGYPTQEPDQGTQVPG